MCDVACFHGDRSGAEWRSDLEAEYLEHGGAVLQQQGDVLVVGVGPVLRAGVLTEGPQARPGLRSRPAKELLQCGLHVGALGLKQGGCREQEEKESAICLKIIRFRRQNRSSGISL